MTVPVPDQLEYVSNADGVTKDFPYPKRFLQKDEIVVLLRDANGVDTPQILNTHYTIAGSSWPSGGTVSFINAPQAPNKVVRYRMTQAKQTVDLENNQRNDAPSVETQLDRLTMGLQDRGRIADIALSGLKAEIQARIAADALLQQNVNAEAAACAAADLQERNERIAGDAALAGSISNERLERIAADMKERAERIAADVAEKAERIGADTVERLQRIAGDKSVASLIGQAGPIEVPFYDTRVAASLANIKSTINSIRTGGFTSPGDGGAALYVRGDGNAPGGFFSNDGQAGWELTATDNQVDFASFGGVDDDFTDNAGAWLAMRLYCIANPSTEVILTQRRTGRFVVNSNFWTGDTEKYRVRGDVTIVSPQSSFRAGTTAIEGELKLFNSAGVYEFQIPSLVNRRFRDLMSGGDLDHSKEKVFAPSTWRKISHVIGSDNTLEVTSGISIYPRFAILTGNVIPVSYPGRWTGGVVPVAARSSYSFGFRPATWNSAGAIIITTKCVHVFYGNRTTRTVTHYYKEVGVAHTTTIIPSVENIGGDYPTDQIGYRFPWASVSVDIPDPNSFQVCINGVALTAPINDGGVVLEVGPVINPGSTSTAQPGDDVTVAGITARESYLPPSLRARGLLYIGSSSTDPAMVSWPFYLEDALQQSFGMQVVRSLNIGLSGGTTTTQLAALQAVDFSGPFPPYTDILCFIGANDIQNQSDRPTFQANIEAMIGIADANSCGILFLLPQIFYSKTEGGGTGSTTTNSEKHALYREYINMVVAEKRATGSRCSVLDTDRILGPILYGYKSYPDKEMEPVIVDNIHISAYSRHQLGVAAARKLMGLYAVRQSGEGGRVSIPDGWKQNGWAGGASFNVCNRVVLMSGELSGGTATDATVILKLPEGLRPAASVTLPITAGGSGVGRVIVAVNGDVSLYGVPTATFLNLGNIQFRLD